MPDPDIENGTYHRQPARSYYIKPVEALQAPAELDVISAESEECLRLRHRTVTDV